MNAVMPTSGREPASQPLRHRGMLRTSRAPMTVSVFLTLAIMTSACTGEERTPERSATVSSPKDSASPDGDAKGTTERPPVAIVLWSGRIAYPLLSLRTWGTCWFEVRRVVRVNVMTLRVVGRETDDCASQAKRHVTSARLTKAHANGGKDIARVVVVSKHPAYRVDAQVPHAIA